MRVPELLSLIYHIARIWSMTDDIAPPQDHLLIQLLTKQCLEDVGEVMINLGQHAVKVIFFG